MHAYSAGHWKQEILAASSHRPGLPDRTATGKEAQMGKVVYRSKTTVTRHQGPLRTATVPAEDRPVTFGVHGPVAEHYGTDPATTPPHATTLDYLVAAAAGCALAPPVRASHGSPAADSGMTPSICRVKR
jgi:hypothetical protein